MQLNKISKSFSHKELKEHILNNILKNDLDNINK